MLKFFTQTLFFFALALFLSNCASISGFQDGRSLGQGTGEFNASLNVASTPKFNDLNDDDLPDSLRVNVPTFYFPNLELGFRYGVHEKIDIGLRLNTNLNLGLNVKAQLVGDHESPFALGLGAEIASFGALLPLWNVQVPLYLSVHPQENLSIYATPRFIYQFAGTVTENLNWNYLGGNGGILFGKRNKFGFDFGYYSINADGESLFSMIQFGVGGRFQFGGNDGSSSKSKKKK